MDTKIGRGIELDKISDEFIGQGHRSRSRDQKGDFQGFLLWVTPDEI